MLFLNRAESGNLYGTTYYGGGGTCSKGYPGCGTIFKLASDGSETVLHAFIRKDGAFPFAGLTADGSGYLYGTTYEGGKSCEGRKRRSCGTFFKQKK